MTPLPPTASPSVVADTRHSSHPKIPAWAHLPRSDESSPVGADLQQLACLPAVVFHRRVTDVARRAADDARSLPVEQLGNCPAEASTSAGCQMLQPHRSMEAGVSDLAGCRRWRWELGWAGSIGERHRITGTTQVLGFEETYSARRRPLRACRAGTAG